MQPRPGAPPAAVRAGPRRHRHVPAQGREEPGLDRADRRHQLPQDRRVRHRTRTRAPSTSTASSTSPTAGMIEFIEVLKLDVAFLYELLGASQEHQIKPKKFPQTVHRRGDHRPHERARVPPPAEQRVHGGAARPHGQDRHPLHHEAQRGDQDLREGLQPGEDPRQAHRPAHDRDGRDVGRADPARGAEEAQPDADAEAQALQRQDAARLHRGQRQGAAQGGPARGHGRDLAALRPGQDLERPGRPT